MKGIERKLNPIVTLLLAVTLAVGFAACGGANSGRAPSGGASPEPAAATNPSGGAAGNSDAVISTTSRAADYNDGALSKMKSLGKSVKDERLIVVGGNSGQTVYDVYTYASGKRASHATYTFFTRGNQKMFDAVKALAAEADEAGLWTRMDGGGAEDYSWQSDYDTQKKIPMAEILE